MDVGRPAAITVQRVGRTVALVALLALRFPSAFAQAPDSSAALFNDQVLHEIRLYINSRDWAMLQAGWALDDHYPADFKWNGQVVRNVSVRSHGGGSRRPNKMSFKIGFNHYTDGQTFLGLEDILLRNNSQDPTNMRERMAMLFFRNLGIPAEREAHTRLYVNDVFYGLFTICEEYDTAVYMQRTFGNTTGRLYEYKYDAKAFVEGSPPYNFAYLGPDAASYVPILYNPKTQKDDPQGEVIGRFMRAISDTDNAAWRSNLSAFLDLPTFIRHLSIENFLGEEDGLTGDYGPNNYYLYRFTDTTLFRFLPWDKSNTFWGAPAADWPIFHNITDGPLEHRDILVVRAFQEPDLLNLYLDTMLECANFDQQGAAAGQPGWLEAEASREFDQIHAAGLDDTSLYSNGEFEQSVADLVTFARNRAASIRAQVAAARGQ
jgi:spore coat protein CotH